MKQLEDIKNLERHLEEEVNKYNYKQNIRWFALIIAIFFFWLITDKILTGVNYLYISDKHIEYLEKKIIKNDFTPKNYDLNNVLGDEVLFTAWDINHRTPRFFTKWAKKNIKNDKTQDYSLSLDQMTLASAAIPLYFYPYEHKKTGNLYSSGVGIAESPSMFALQHAIERLKKDPKTIRLVNVGNINSLPQKLSTKASLLAWVERLPSLYSESKTHTMKYMTTAILNKFKNKYHNFEI